MTYLIVNDGYKYQEFALEIEDIINLVPDDSTYDISDLYSFSVKNLSFKQWWLPIEADFTAIGGDTTSPVPDISLWIGATLILSPRAYRTLSEMLAPHGEMLPVNIKEQTFYIFNCLELAKEDEILSEQVLSEGMVMGIKKLIFDTDSTNGKAAFKSEYAGCLDVFCDQKFKNAVMKNNLTGVAFSENLVREF